MSRTILGLDIGGANLKAATNSQQAATIAFPLWQQPDQLSSALQQLAERFGEVHEFAITMTGELCDCFATKTEGVRHILAAVRSISRSFPVRVWSTQGRFLSIQQAHEDPLSVAAANWHALASYCGSMVPQGTGLLVDIGSTTTDLIPILDGAPDCRGTTDHQRLQARQLLYTGARRTPICALLPAGSVAAEWFATTLDAYLLMGFVPDSDDTDTADHRPATRQAAHARMARLYCADASELSEERTLALAERASKVQMELISSAIESHIPILRDMQSWSLGTRRVAILSGSGEFLAHRIMREFLSNFTDVISLTERLGSALATAAPAYAVARLAAERPLV